VPGQKFEYRNLGWLKSALYKWFTLVIEAFPLLSWILSSNEHLNYHAKRRYLPRR